MQPKEVWFMGPLEHRPNRVVEIEATLDKKVAATSAMARRSRLLASWFVPGADPRKLTPAQRGQLQGGARKFPPEMGRKTAAPSPAASSSRAPRPFVQRTGPGHLDNYPNSTAKCQGAPEPPTFE